MNPKQITKSTADPSHQADSDCNLQNRSRPPLFFLLRLGPVFILALAMFLVTFLWLLGPPPLLKAAEPPLRYVAPAPLGNDNGGSNGCASRFTPCATIQQAIDKADDNDEIRVAAGNYIGTVNLTRSLTLRGGFTTTNWVTPDPDLNPTIIDAQNAGRVIYLPDAVVAKVSGFHLTGGQIVGTGGGVFNSVGTLTLEDNEIYKNVANGDSGGGGVANGGSASTTLIGNRIYSNTSSVNGGGISIVGGVVAIEANEIFANSTSGVGGGIVVFNSTGVTLKSNLIYTNTADDDGGGLAIAFGTTTIENDTIYDNNSSDDGGGIYTMFTETLSITNTLIISNTAGSGGGIHSPGPSSIAFTDFFGNSPDYYAGGMVDPVPGNNNRNDQEPAFVDAPNFDLHLSPGSPAIDTGAITTTATTDFEGDGRPFGSGMDRGADEFTDPSNCYARVEGGRVYIKVQDAIDAAGPGDLVQVAGLCTETISITQSLTLRGGYTVTDWVYPQYGPSILNANGAGRVIDISGASAINPVIEQLRITGGLADFGAGVYLGDNVNATLRNNVIYDNRATSGGGGVYNSGSGDALLQHNTIVSNTATISGGGVLADNAGGSGQVRLESTIVVNNSAAAGGGLYMPTGGRSSLYYNDFYANTPNNYDGDVVTGTTDISVVPNFKGAADFHLTLASELINQADPSSALGTDFENEERPQGGRSDIGADESLRYILVDLDDILPPDNPYVITDTAAAQGKSVTFTHTITNLSDSGSATETFVISATNSHGWTVSPASQTRVLTVGVPVTFDIVVVISNTAILTGVYNQTFITVTSTSNEAWLDSAMDIIANPGLVFTPNYTDFGDPGEVLTYSHTLLNTGPADTFIITLNSPRNWGELVTPNPIPLGHNETTQVVVRVAVTDTAPAGLTDIMTITATSAFDISATVTDTTTANATGGDRYVAQNSDGGDDFENNCRVSEHPCDTIPYALGQAASGDEVYVAQNSNPYVLTGTLLINQNVNLRGGGYDTNFGPLNPDQIDPTTTIIEPTIGPPPFDNGPGLRISVAPLIRPVIEGFTLRGFSNASDLGGGIVVVGSSAPTLTHLIVENTLAVNGGGIYIDSGSPFLQNVTISNTTASYQGGGIYVNTGSPLLQNVVITGSKAISNSGNSGRGGGIYINNSGAMLVQGGGVTNTQAIRGGGIYLENGNLTLQSGAIYSASATTGGGIYQQDGHLTTQKLQIQQNSAGAQGGGLYQVGGTLTISQTHLNHNRATAGGGLYSPGGILTLWNNFVYSNTATTGNGGGIYKDGGTLNLVNNTLYGNQAANLGGGIFDNNSGSLVLSNTIVAANHADADGGGLYRLSSGSSAIDYNNFWNNSAAGLSPDHNLPSAGSHSLAVDPLFVDAAAGDLHLTLDSPSVDTADPNTFLVTDIEDDLRPSGQGFDMGGDEVAGCLARVVEPLTGVPIPSDEGQINFGVIQEAVDMAPDSKKVQVHGICRGVNVRWINGQPISQTVFISKSLTLEGGYNSNFSSNDPDTWPTLLDARGQGRVVAITRTSFAIPDVYILSLTLTGGDATGLQGAGNVGSGGGVHNANSYLTLRNSVITGNHATRGGGIYHFHNIPGGYYQLLKLGGDTEEEGTYILSNTATLGGGLYVDSFEDPLLNHVTFGRNATTGSGGGMYLFDGSPVIQNNQFEENSAAWGGGIYNAGGSATISQTQFYSNTANNAGAVYNNSWLSGRMLTVNGNSATGGGGGGFYNGASGQLFVDRNLVLTNTATANGGGLYNSSGGVLAITNTIIASNTATSGDGGGLYNQSNSLTLRHDTLYGNEAGNQGGGIYHDASNSSPVINSTMIVSNNAANEGGGIHSAGADPDFDYNDVVDNNTNYGGNLAGGDGDGNISASPSFASTDPASDGFLRLISGSNGEEDGDPDSPIDVDIDGDPRPSNESFDIGADEVANCYARIRRPGTGWLSPLYGKVQTAVDNSQNGDEILVAHVCQGADPYSGPMAGQTVTQTVFLTKSLTIWGGYTKDNWTSPDPIANQTVLDALQVGRVFYITGTAQVTITGLHLTGGAAASGGDANKGGAVFLGSANNVLTMTENLIYSNTASCGGALYSQAGSAYIYEAVFTSTFGIFTNTATTYGGAICNEGGQITLDTNDLRANTATTRGGAVYHNGGSTRLRNNIVRNNTAPGSDGGAIYNNTSGLEVWHNTFYNNSANNGGGLYTSDASPDVRNNIFYDDSGSSIIYSSASYTVTYNNVDPNSGSPLGGSASNGEGNLFGVDPNLLDPANGDFHIAENSPVIDKGDSTMDRIWDFENDRRPGDQNFDMGADERHSCWAQVTPPGASVSEFSGPIYGGIQLAINNSQPGDEVRVSVGECRGVHTYTNGGPVISQTVHITHNLILRGGFNTDFNGGGDEGPGNYPDTNATAIDPRDFTTGLSLGRAILITNSAVVTMERFMLVYGDAAGLGGGPGGDDAGGGLYYGPSAQGSLTHVDFYTNTAAYGGAFFNASDSLLMRDSWIKYNTAITDGGAIYNVDGEMTITYYAGDEDEHTQVFSNTAGLRGGGIYNDSGTVILSNNTEKPLSLNKANRGGFLYNNDSTSVVTITNNIIYGNIAANEGGAIYNNAGQMFIGNSEIRDHTVAGGSGGAIYNNAGQVALENNRIYGNNVDGGTGGGLYNDVDGTMTLDLGNRIYQNNAHQGGGIYHVGSSGSITVHNTLIYINTAGDRGGGIYSAGGDSEILHNTFYQNEATGGTSQGGAIYIQSGNPTIKNNIFDSGQADTGSAIFSTDGGGTLGYNGYYNNENEGAQVQPGGIIGSNNLYTDTLLVNKTEYDFHLTNLSPLIDQAESGLGVTYDFENNPRPVNAGPDIGADENNACLAQVVSVGLPPADWGPGAGPIFGSIQAALDAANVGHEIRVAKGVCEENITVSEAVPIDGSWEKDFLRPVIGSTGRTIVTTIDAQNNGNVVTVESDASSATLSWLRLANGNFTNGGGVWTQANLTLRAVEVADNYADSKGGGIYVAMDSQKTLNLTLASEDSQSVIVSDNEAGQGGGIYVDSGNTFNMGGGSSAEVNKASGRGGGVYLADNVTATLSGLIWDNEATGDGGGLYNGVNSQVSIFSGSINDNSAGGNGGGMYNDSGSYIDIRAGTPVANNQAVNNGGGVYNYNATFELTNKQINSNQATAGGGIYATGGNSVLTLTNLGLYNNTADNGGGLYQSSGGSAKLYHATIRQNQAQIGGGVYAENGIDSLVISASIVAFNTADLGSGGVYGDGLPGPGIDYTLRWINGYSGTIAYNSNELLGDPHFYNISGDLSYNSAAIDTIPPAESHVTFDRVDDERPLLCRKDMGRDEYAVGERAMTFVNSPTPQGATLSPLEFITYTFTLRNDSKHYLGLEPPNPRGAGTGFTETIRLSVPSTKQWAEIVAIEGGANVISQPVTSVPTATFEIGPGQVVVLIVKVTVAGDAQADDVDQIWIEYEALDCPDYAKPPGPPAGSSEQAETRVVNDFNFDIGPDDNTGAALPGTSVTYTHIITNIGNVEDSYIIFPNSILYASGQIITVTSGQFIAPNTVRVTLTPEQTETIVIRVDIRPEIAGGLEDITYAVAQSENIGAQKSAPNTTAISYTTGIRYVAPYGNDSPVPESQLVDGAEDVNDNNCTQTSPPCQTIQHSLSQAAGGDEIRVAAGTYSDLFTITHKTQPLSQTVFISKPVTLRGGYQPPNWSQEPPDHMTNTTIISPAQGRAIFIAGGIDFTRPVTIDRLFISGGDAAGLRGGPGDADAGGNIYNEGADLILHANRIYDGQAELGGGLYSGGGELLLKNNLLYDNQANTDGGALYITGTATLLNNTFFDNQATGQGGAVYMTDGSLLVTNTIFATNTASSGGAVQVSGGATAALNFNLYVSASDSVVGATSDLNTRSGDPRFVNPADSPPDLHLQLDSPARDTGDPGTDTTTQLRFDYDNQLRAQALQPVDIGAYEYFVEPGLELVTHTNTITDSGEVFVINHILKNTGEVDDVFTITHSSSQGWATLEQATPYTIQVGAGLTATVTVAITAGNPGEIDITIITATSHIDPNSYDFVIDTTTVTFVPGIQFVKDESGAVEPLQTITYTHILTNAGTGQDDFNFSDDAPAGWTVAISPPGPVTLPAGGDQVITVTITPPGPDQAISGTISVIHITATSQFSSAISAAVTDTTTISQVFGLNLVADETGTGQPGQGVSYAHYLTNQSNFTQTANLTYTTVPSDWPVSLSPLSQTLAAGQVATITVVVTVPVGTPVGITNVTRITAELQSKPSISATVVDTTTTGSQAAVIIEPPRTGSGLPGQIIVYTHTVTNTGNTTDTFDLSFSGSSFNPQLLSSSPITLASGDSGPVTVTVQIPGGAISGTVDVLIVSAISRLDPFVGDTVTDTTTVQRRRAVIFVPDRLGNGGLNDTVVYTHTLTNDGNFTDTFVLTYTSSLGWPVGLQPAVSTPIELGAGDSTLVTATVTITTGDPLETTVITASVQDDGSIFDVVTDTTVFGLAPPILRLPPNNHITTTNTITFAWSDTGALSYTLDLSGTLYTVTETYSPTTLEEGVYTWTVASQSGVFTDIWTVTVDLNPPTVPTPTYPLSDTTILTNTAPFTWDASSDTASGVLSYTVVVTGPTPYSNTVSLGDITATIISLGADGVYTWMVQAIDAAGYESGYSNPVTFTVDTTAPDKPYLIAPPDGTVTNTTAITLEWSKVEQALTYTLHLSSSTFDITLFPGATVISPTTLSDGVYTWTVEAIDSFGRSSYVTETWVFTIDATPPPTPTLISPISGTITSTNPITFTWSDVGEEVAYYLKWTFGTTTTVVEGPFAITSALVGLTEGDGVYSWTVEAVDAAGNHSGYTDTWRLELAGAPPPRPNLISPISGTLFATSTVAFEWSDTGAVTYTLAVSGSTYPVFTTTHTLTNLAEGVYTWTVAALGSTGQTNGYTDTWVFTVDVTPPDPPVLELPISGTLFTTGTVTFNWTEPADNLSGVLTYTLAVSGNQYAVLTNTHTLTGLADGVYTWTVQAIDRAGNSSAFTDTWVFIIDTSPLQTPTLLLPPDETLTNSLTITFAWSSVGPAGTITYTLNVSGTLEETNTNSHVFTVPGEGSYTWTVKAANQSGASTGYTDTWTVYVDTTPPTTPTQISPVAPTVVTTNTLAPFTWQASTDNSPYPISYTVVVTGPTPYAYSGTVGVTSTNINLGADGVYTWVVQAIDAAGNPSGFSTPVTFTLDAVAPDIPFLIAPPDGTITNSTAITLEWSWVIQALTYTLHLTPVGTFDLADPGSGPSVISPTTLSEGVYTWTVEAIDGDSRSSGITDTWVFTIDTTLPPRPILISPISGTVTATNLITFTWLGVGEADHYNLRWTFGTAITVEQSFTTTFGLVDLTEGDGVYSWTVEAVDAAGNHSGYTDTWRLELDGSPPPRPNLIFPISGTLLATDTVTFEWSDTGGVTYTLAVSDSLHSITGITHTLSGLADGVYTWTVAAYNILSLTTGFTDTWLFTIDATPPSPPTPMSPVTGTVMTTNTVPFTWTASTDNLSGVVSYTVVVTGPTQIYSQTVGSITATNISLGDDGLYTWTVQAIDAAGNKSSFGSPITFTVDANAPDQPFLIAPPNGTITSTTTITIEWSRVIQALTYTLHLTPVGTFNIADPGSGTSVISPTVLGEGIYTWTVEAIDSDSRSSNITDTWVFTIDTTLPSMPALISPISGTITNTNPITFTWSDAGADAVYYNLQWTFGTTTTVEGPFTTTSALVNLTEGDGVYTWTVESMDAAGNHSGYTDTWTLRYDTQPPLAPTLIAPIGGVVLVNSSVVFSWTAVTDTPPSAISYLIIITDSNNSQVTSVISTNTIITLPITPDGVYTWTVQAIDEAGNISSPGGPESFSVDANPPDQPVLINPPNQTFTNNSTVMFMWSSVSGAITYTLSLTDNFYSVPISLKTFTGLPDGVYTWTVRSIDAYSRTLGYTDSWRVTVDTTPPTPPTLNLPLDGAVISTTAQPTFDWTDSLDTLSGPVTYTIVITASDGITQTFGVTDSEFIPSDDLPNGVYTWTVYAYDQAGNVSASSQVFRLTMEVKVSIHLPLIFKGSGLLPPLPKPDLVITSIDATPNPGGGYTVQVIATNQSSILVTNPNNFHVAVYLDDDFSSYVLIWGVQGEWFGAGQSRVLVGTYPGPAGTLKAWADPFDVVDESDEDNNISTGLVITGLGSDAEPQDSPSLPSGPLPTPTNVP